MSSEFKEVQDSPGFLMWEVRNFWQKKIRQALKPLNLNHMQFVVRFAYYWLVSESEGDITQVQLAQHAPVDVNATSQVLTMLERQGYITRRTYATDTRAKVIAPTAGGTDLALRAVPVVEAADRELFSAIGSERKQFIQLLRRLR